MKQRPLLYMAAAASVLLVLLLVLLLAPQTRWLVRLQALTSLRLYYPLPSGPCYTGSSAGDRRRVEAVAARHPNDYAVQYAAAVTFHGMWPVPGVPRSFSHVCTCFRCRATVLYPSAMFFSSILAWNVSNRIPTFG